MDLKPAQRRYLRGLAHPLNPVVFVGKEGLSEGVVRKVSVELDNHELIKVKATRDLATPLAEAVGACLVQTIGHVVVLYRRRKKEPAIVLPGA